MTSSKVEPQQSVVGYGPARSIAGLPILTGAPLETGICMAIYGAGGSGKTTVLSEVVLSDDGNPALLIDAEGGSSSVSHLIPHGLDVVQVQKWPDVMKLLRTLDSPDSKYRSVIADNMSELQSMCMRNITTEQPQIQHWGQCTAEMLRFTRMLRDLSRFRALNTLFTVWEETEKDEELAMLRRKVSFTPKLAASFPGIVTMVGQLSVVARDPNYVRKLTFAPSPNLDSKFRVSPQDNAAGIPLELYIRKDAHFLVDFLATVNHGIPFPVARYAAPERANRQNR